MVSASLTVTVASLTSTFVPAVTKAAVNWSWSPVIATAFVTVTVPAVLPPSVLRFAAVNADASASFTVIVITSVPAVVRDPKLARESAASVAVTTPVVLAAIAFNSEIVGVSSIVTAASDTSTKVPAVTKAAVTCAVVPEIATAFVTVTVPAVFPPMALKSSAFKDAASASFTVIVISSVPEVVRDPRSAVEAAANVAVTTPVVLAATAFNSAIVGVSLIVTVASLTNTKLPDVTNAAVT